MTKAARFTSAFKRLPKAHTLLSGSPCHLGHAIVLQFQDCTLALVAPDKDQLETAYNHLRGVVARLDPSLIQPVAMFNPRAVIDITEGGWS